MMETIKPTHIYVLALENDKYYVGISDVHQSRIMSHFTNNGSAWTRKYRPEGVIKVIKGDVFDEDKVTKQFMHQYGVDNVRGGSYCQMILSSDQRNTLEKEFKTIDNRCFHCGKNGHFTNKCPLKKKKDGKDVKKNEKKNEKKEKRNPLPTCDRCGRFGHKIEQCYVKFDVDNYSIESMWSSEEEEEEEELL